MKRLSHARDRAVLGAQCLAAAGLAIATDTTKVQNGNAVDFAIGAKAYSKAATDDLVAPSGDTQGKSTKALYLISLDSAGNPNATQSAIKASGGDVAYPDLPDDEAPIGAIKVETNDSTTFEPGTTALNASGVTTTYIDLNRVPAGTE